MTFSITLSEYIVKNFLKNFIFIFLIFAGLIFIIDFVELLREVQSKEVAISKLVEAVLYKIPYLVISLLPFIFLFSSTLTFSKFNNNFELAAIKSIGVSIWSLVIPLFFSIFVLSAIFVFIFQPISAVLLDYNSVLGAKIIGGGNNKISIQEKGIWLHESDNSTQEKIIKIMKVKKDKNIFSNITVFIAGENKDFQESYKAQDGFFKEGNLTLINVKKFLPGEEAKEIDKLDIRTELTPKQIQENIPIPDEIKFWKIPSFIKLLKQAGFSPLKHEYYYYNLIMSPLLNIALVLIGLVFSLSLPRKGRVGVSLLSSAITGVIVFFIVKVFNILALTSVLPVYLSLLIPFISILLVFLLRLIQIEELN